MRSDERFPNGDLSTIERGFRRFLWYSVGLHLVALVLFSVRAYLSPSDPIPFESVIRVDIVGLPDRNKPAELAVPAPPAAKPPPANLEKPEAAKPELPKISASAPKSEIPKINLNKTKLMQEAALKRLEAIEKLKRTMNEDAQKIAAAAASAAAKAQPQVKGNELSRGAALRGITKLNYENYQDTAHEHIRKYWNLPHWLSNANLNAKVRVWVDSQGNILRKELTSKSTQPAFDERALHALESATPLPPPPSALVGLLAVEGIEIEFVPEH
jgi:TonB family protein